MATSRQKAIELLRRQIKIGENMPFYGIWDDSEDYGRWRTTCEGILARIDNAWARRFWDARYSQGGNRAQVAQLGAFVDLLEIEDDDPDPAPAAQPRVALPAQNVITNNFHGDHGRAYFGSEDNSTNTVSTHVQVWAEIDKVLGKAPATVRDKLAEKARAAKDAQGTKSYSERWSDMLATAANYCTVLGTLWPILATLFQQVAPAFSIGATP